MQFKFLPFIRHMSMAMLLFCCTIVVSGQSKTETLTNKTVIDLTKAGLGNDLIISKINASTVKFDLSSAALVELKKQGVKDEVLAVMMDKESGGPGKPASPGQPGNYGVTMLNHVHIVKDGKASPLEKQVAGIRTKTKALGYGGVSSLLQIPGKNSTVRLTAGQPAKFIINTGGAAPELALYRAKISGTNRQAESAKATMIGMKTGQNVVQFNVSQFKDGLYEIVVPQSLESGEYFFTGKAASGANSIDAFAFGID